MTGGDGVGASTSAGTAARPSTLGPQAGGIVLGEIPDGPYDVLVGGRRIWSFNPARDAKRNGAGWHVPWPPPLVPHLDGVGHFTIVEHNDGQLLFDGEVCIGRSDVPITVTDAAGHQLSIDKTGHLGRSFGERDEEQIAQLMRATKAALDLLHDNGIAAFLAFGGLLGATRDGHLIGHDVDVDLGYLSAHRSPADAARESFELERAFRRAGWKTWRFSADDFKVQADGVQTAARWIDIFGGFVADDTFYLMPNVAVPESSVHILPLGEVVLEGQALAAPGDVESLLVATYGPGWRVPDPSFKYRTPQAIVRRFDAWMRTAIAMRGHWLPFYDSAKARAIPAEASAFGEWVAGRLEPGSRVVDLGCGTGRDTVWFAQQGFDALGLDYVPSALNRARSLAGSRDSGARFESFNLLDTRHVLVRGAQLRDPTRPLSFYGRFLITALTDRARENLWLLCRMALHGGGRLYLEFRSGTEPQGATYAFGHHFRKFLGAEKVAAEIAEHGGTVEFEQEGCGMAVYQDEDPFVCRMVASW